MLKIRHGEPERAFNVLSLDTEDSDGHTYIWCVRGIFNGEPVNEDFTSRAECVKFLFRRRWPHTVLTGVNLSYDLNTLLYRGGFNWDVIYNMGKLITASPNKETAKKHKLGREYIKIIELGNWILNTSLKGMCEMFDIEGHIDKHVLGRDGTEAELIEACGSHALTGALCFDYIQTQAHDVGARVKLTSSSTALDLFLKNYLKPEHQIFDYENDFPSRFIGWGDIVPGMTPTNGQLEAARMEKLTNMRFIGGKCYVGGRTEAFNLGVYGWQSSIDINSSYPYQMRNKIFPDMNTYTRGFPDVKTLIKMMEAYEGCAHVQVTAPKSRIPFLHHKSDGKLLFPVGTFKGWYTFPELRKALSLGYKILQCFEAGYFKGIKGLFTGYVDGMYHLKENKKTKIMSKLLMNGLSGKMGQRKHDDSGYHLLHDVPDELVIDNNQYFLLDGLVYEYVKPDSDAEVEYTHTSYPLLVAYVTAYARIQLYEAMESIGLEHIKYVDTDSIHADTNAILDAVKKGKITIHDKALGAWGYDYQDATIEIRGLKYYRVRRPEKDDPDSAVSWHYTVKGVRAAEQAQYWQNHAIRTNRVRKIRATLRNGGRLNEFFSIYRRDKLENPKREYTPRNSNPFELI